ncbi:hypothetical protein [Paraburkholderia sediminicola]|uniref:hypothetical protein n=1 Tax=Paraburkholderia sediminicola TaxID=458836 RepID=UPI0038B81A77
MTLTTTGCFGEAANRAGTLTALSVRKRNSVEGTAYLSALSSLVAMSGSARMDA